MTRYSKVVANLEASLKLHSEILNDTNIHRTLFLAAQNAAERINRGGKIIFAGNGGSFADAQHLAAEFIGTMGRKRKSLPAIALGTNSSSLTAIGNDYSFNQIFVRELKALGSKDDYIVLISTSGLSKNLVELIETIKEKEIESLALVGKNGGELSKNLPNIIVPSFRTERIQECHILLGHIFCELVEDNLSDMFLS
jgi:D-sedoheptulose 7-phosphate isomerase